MQFTADGGSSGQGTAIGVVWGMSCVCFAVVLSLGFHGFSYVFAARPKPVLGLNQSLVRQTFDVASSLPRQSKTLPSLSASAPFEIKQMLGACHLPEKLSMQAMVQYKGYAELGIQTEWVAQQLHVGHPMVALSGENAELLASLTLGIVSEHVRRNLVFTHGLPKRQSLLLGSAENRDSFILQLRKDYDNFERMLDESSDSVGRLAERSVFKLAAVEQLMGCLAEEGWQATPRRIG